MRRFFFIALAITGLGLGAVWALASLHEPTRSTMAFIWSKWHGPYTVEDRLAQLGERVGARLQPDFAEAGLPYPPYEVAYVAFKDTRVLELHARGSESEPWRFVKRYAVRGASGGPGPKLAEGDRQVPEGVYQAEFLNANSRFHLSIRLNYPNDFDRQMARNDGRTKLGGDIMIHGSSASVGCLAMGDEAAEELFILAALVTLERTRIVVSPTDFRLTGIKADPAHPAWVPTLYQTLQTELQQYPQ